MSIAKLLKHELNLLLNALSFFSRVPVPNSVTYNATSLSQCVAYFPFVGWLVAWLSAAVMIGLIPVLGAPLAVLLSMVASCWATGAFHEDGFADCCDGFGGGYQTEQILTIMKDSRLGTYGVLGLCCMLALKFSALLSLSQQLSMMNLLLVIWLAHSLSRFSAVLLIWRLDYVREPSEPSKAKAVAQSIGRKELVLALCWVAVPAILISTDFLALALISSLVVTVLWARYLNLKLGGYTGDGLGAQQQLAEVMIYIALVAGLNTGVLV
ncbi:adenosylcobinamide-GDP ribazoletransferase [Agarivorans sp. Toyoura001]|uniref:adenosylcobinamide-GDP ribazoletransferase n=1 Tax=Agarivorans sp. Toyoura001 TaxID=2283141 RepID=UPI0010DD5F74|nr:adenosylcobinamide-GDP ribazoletransferase [Agarivorans sp. Toyoura001]GDY25468.1 adenosylcobinamide-GDP ribazoletransferase [Agarivorans sp. Toyoura001]